MADYFALLGEPRRPWLDSEVLKQKFLTLSATTHPDRVHNASAAERELATERFTALNAAHNCLQNPKDRLRHLLELETGAKPSDLQEIPAALADLFLEIASLRQQAARFQAERAKADSPLLRVRFFEQSQDWIEKLTALQQRLGQRQAAVLADLQQLDAQWQQETDRAGLLRRVEEMYRLISFYSRWNLQLQETIVQLSF